MTEEERYEKEMADEDARIQFSAGEPEPTFVPHMEENAGHMFLDLQRELSLSPEFINKVMRVYQDMVLADKSGERTAFRHHMTELLRLCDYNPSLLAPIFFPDFEGGGPMTFWERPHAMAMLSMTPTGTITVQASMAPLHGQPGVQKKVNCWKPKATAMVISSQACAALTEHVQEGSETIPSGSSGQAAAKCSTPGNGGDDIVRSARKRAAGCKPGYGVASVLNEYTPDWKMFGYQHFMRLQSERNGSPHDHGRDIRNSKHRQISVDKSVTKRYSRCMEEKCRFPGCNKTACGKGDARHYCCITHYYQARRLKKGTLKLSDLTVKCELCGIMLQDMLGLTRHLVSVHGVGYTDGGLEEYYRKYLMKASDPQGTCVWCGAPTSFTTLGKGYSRFCYNKDCNVRWYNANTNRLEKSSSGIRKARSAGDNVPTQLGYWIKRGYTETEAKRILRERQTTNSVESIMKRENITREEAEIKRKEITDKWSAKVHTGMNFSMASQDLFWRLWAELKDTFSPDDVFFATFVNGTHATDKTNHEYRLQTDRSYRLPDFYIKSIGMIIEFDGTFHHSSRWRKATFDEDRDGEILRSYPDHTIFHVSEASYAQDKDAVVQACLAAIEKTKEHAA